MTPLPQAVAADQRGSAYGQHGLTAVDRFGVWLSKRAILRRMRGAADLVVADLGCGYQAVLLRALLPWLREGVGVDLKVSGEARQIRKLSFVEGRLEDALPRLAEDRFDLVLLISVLEHLADPLGALRHCWRVLTAGGRLLVNVPTWRGKWFLECSAFRLGTSPACEMDDHKMYYDKRDLWPLLVKAGFKPSRLELRYHKFGLNLFAVAVK